jgi:hypothetical protein
LSSFLTLSLPTLICVSFKQRCNWNHILQTLHLWKRGNHLYLTTTSKRREKSIMCVARHKQ